MSVDSMGRIIVGSGHVAQRAAGIIGAEFHNVVRIGNMTHRARDLGQAVTHIDRLARLIPRISNDIPPVAMGLRHVITRGGEIPSASSHVVSGAARMANLAPQHIAALSRMQKLEKAASPQLRAEMDFIDAQLDKDLKTENIVVGSRRNDVAFRYDNGNDAKVELVKHHPHKEHKEHKESNNNDNSQSHTEYRDNKRAMEVERKRQEAERRAQEESRWKAQDDARRKAEEQARKEAARKEAKENLDNSLKAGGNAALAYGSAAIGDFEGAVGYGYEAATQLWDIYKKDLGIGN